MPGINLGLPRITSLLRALHSPHLRVPIIHIAGTNGKGSISAYLSSVLLQASSSAPPPSLKVGRFNSPHLVDEWDCIELNGTPVGQVEYERIKQEVQRADREGDIGASSFEILTATAFSVFAAQETLDLAIVEVGMGGRTDATNVVPRELTLLSIISSIELDHQKFLGETLEEIADVKGGIIKGGVEVVVAKQMHGEVERVMERIGEAMGSKVYFAGVAAREDSTKRAEIPMIPLRQFPPSPTASDPASIPNATIEAFLPLPGSYQLVNASAATLAAQILRTSSRIHSLIPSLSALSDIQIIEGIQNTRWPGRLDWITLPVLPPLCSPHLVAKASGSTILINKGHTILIDGAHNPSSATLLADYLQSLSPSQAPSTLIIGLSAPRSPISILEPLLRNNGGVITRIIAVGFTPPAGMEWINATEPSIIAAAVREVFGDMRVEECANIEEAMRLISMDVYEDSREKDKRIVVAGSLYLAADVYRLKKLLEGN